LLEYKSKPRPRTSRFTFRLPFEAPCSLEILVQTRLIKVVDVLKLRRKMCDWVTLVKGIVSKGKKHDKAKNIHAASVAIASRHSLYILYVCLAHENERVDARQTSRLSHSQTNRSNQNNAVRNSGTPRKRTRWLRARNFLCQLVDHLSHLSLVSSCVARTRNALEVT
jgi:hypothetical protein